MYINRCPSPDDQICTKRPRPKCPVDISTNDNPTCCVAVIPPTYSGQIIDIIWNGEAVIGMDVPPPTRPPHSYILGVDTLPLGYSYDVLTGRLFFPPNVIISESQFALLTPPVTQNACGSWDWTATSICVFVKCQACSDFS